MYTVIKSTTQPDDRIEVQICPGGETLLELLPEGTSKIQVSTKELLAAVKAIKEVQVK